ncbi:MAG: TolC family protein, partial [Spirochaetota bacterium]
VNILQNILLLIALFHLLFCGLAARPKLIRLNINKAILVGTANSVILKTIKAKDKTLTMAITEKWRNYLPRVGLSYYGLKNINDNQSDSRYNDIRLNIQQLIYDGGENDLMVETAKLDRILNSKDFQISREKLALEIRKNYIAALSNVGKLYLVRRSLENTMKEIKELQLQKQTGFKTEYERLQSLAKLREVEFLYSKVRGKANRSIIDLKQILNLDIGSKIVFEEEIFRDYYIYPPYIKIKRIAQTTSLRKGEVRKSQAMIENLKKQKEMAEGYWKPKVFVGAYVGQNVNGPLPTRNQSYGLNLSIQARIGSTTSETSGNFGVQESGNGIERIPGFGPQFVGKGENAYNSSNLQFFDDLSYSRKILEGKIKWSEAIHNHKTLKNELMATVYKNYDTLVEKWHQLRINNSKVYLRKQAFDLVSAKYNEGFAKRSEVLDADLELLKAQDELADALKEYMNASNDLLYAAGLKPGKIRFYQFRKNRGNSLIAKLYPDYWKKRSQSWRARVKSPQKPSKTVDKPNKGNDYKRKKDKDMDYFFD